MHTWAQRQSEDAIAAIKWTLTTVAITRIWGNSWHRFALPVQGRNHPDSILNVASRTVKEDVYCLSPRRWHFIMAIPDNNENFQKESLLITHWDRDKPSQHLNCSLLRNSRPEDQLEKWGLTWCSATDKQYSRSLVVRANLWASWLRPGVLSSTAFYSSWLSSFLNQLSAAV